MIECPIPDVLLKRFLLRTFYTQWPGNAAPQPTLYDEGVSNIWVTNFLWLLYAWPTITTRKERIVMMEKTVNLLELVEDDADGVTMSRR